MEHRVVITGLGAVTPIGVGVGKFWEATLASRSGARLLTRFNTDNHGVKFACTIEDFDPGETIDPKELDRMDRYTQFAVAASEYAVRDSGIDLSSLDQNRFGVIVGSGIGGVGTLEPQIGILNEKGPRRVSPLLIPMMISDIAAGMIAIRYGFKGPNYAVVTACATGSHCIGEAFNYIRRGLVDGMIAGGSEAAITPIGFTGFAAMRQVLSKRNDAPEQASRPFDADRDGFVMGEGAGIVLMESLEHALKRGAPIYAEVCGFGLTGDAHHITAVAPGGDGAVRAMRMAMNDGQVNPEQIGYINAHGTSTPLNDREETLAIKTTFGDHAKSIGVSSTKSQTGHLLGAAGGVEAVAVCMALKHQIMPPTINYTTPDPECDLDYVPNHPREKKFDYAISNSMGFGGHNAALVFRRWAGSDS